MRGIGLSASDPEIVFGAVEEGWLVRSNDGGDSWVNIKDGTEFDSHTVTVLPDGETVVSASGHGLYRSADGGETFAQSDAGISHPYLIDVALHRGPAPGAVHRGSGSAAAGLAAAWRRRGRVLPERGRRF